MGVVPGEARPDPETLGQVSDARFCKPCFRRFTAVPEINAAGAAFTVQVVLSDQSFFGEAAIGRRGRSAAFHRLLLGTLWQIELNDNDAIGHGWSSRCFGNHAPNSARRSKADLTSRTASGAGRSFGRASLSALVPISLQKPVETGWEA